MFDIKWRRLFLILVGVMFVLGALIYGTIGVVFREDMGAPGYAVFLFPIMGGWLLGGLVGGIMMVSRWLRGQTTAVKVLSAVLFPITFMAVGYGGILGSPVMVVYCIVTLRREKRVASVKMQ